MDLNLANTRQRYGLVHRCLHWLVALTVIGMFALGLWMVDLDYYSAWYQEGPDLHRSIGLTLFMVMLIRVLWVIGNPRPEPLHPERRLETLAAGSAHVFLYLLIFTVMVSGYLISTADGRGIEVFGLFEVPSITGSVDRMEDTAGEVHEWAAWGLIVLASVHALAALKHHFLDRDDTLRRMASGRHTESGQ